MSLDIGIRLVAADTGELTPDDIDDLAVDIMYTPGAFRRLRECETWQELNFAREIGYIRSIPINRKEVK